MHVEREYLYKSHVHCLDNHTHFTVAEAKAHESSLYAQRSTANGLSDFKVRSFTLSYLPLAHLTVLKHLSALCLQLVTSFWFLLE